MGAMSSDRSGRQGQIFEFLARLPARVWLQGVLALIGIAVLAFLGFALIAGVAAAFVLVVLAYKAKAWFLGLINGSSPPARRGRPKAIDVEYEVVERKNGKRRH
jgi:hypothetical protein